MTLEKLPLEHANNFTNIFKDYLSGNSSLEKYYDLPPNLESFEKALKDKKLPAENRKKLQQVLKKQYKDLVPSKALEQNLQKLTDERTFTITTGHQLNIFTGPLYFIYKIVTVINLCKKLKEAHPEYHFVPVYWMASEDHDFEEINHFHLFGRNYVWETQQQGAVGRFNPEEISAICEQLPERIALFEKAYTEHKTLADATRYFVNELFGEEGLIALDADDATLKGLFEEVIKDDLTQHTAKSLVEDTSKALDALDYKTQVYSRDINFFYLDEGLRERIVKDDGKYQVLNTDIQFSEEELLKLVEEHPEKFSPNVILRPLYQEMILPNLAYVGGPAEVAYWLQLKAVFDHYQQPFPILLPRNFALIISKSNARKMNKIPLDVRDMFMDVHDLVKKFLDSSAEHGIQLKKEKEILQEVFTSVKNKVTAVDKSLDGFIGAEANKAEKILENIEKRLKKSEERNQETSVKQIEALKEKLFPGAGLQERHDNFLNFYINSPEILRHFLDHFDPLDFRFNILIEDE